MEVNAMYRSVLVPLDGSRMAEQALPLAMSVAQRAGATLRLVQVHVPSGIQYAVNFPPFIDYQSEARFKEQERAYLDGVVKRLTTVTTTSALLEGATVAQTLTDDAKTHGVDLLVMTTHGRGPFSRFWIGSVADQLVRSSPIPLLVVRPKEGVPDHDQEPRLRHILIPLDGSELAEKILAPAVALGRLTSADYCLLGVHDQPAEMEVDPLLFPLGPGYSPCPNESKAVDTYLERVAQRLRVEGLTVRTRTVSGQPAATAILHEAQAGRIDLIAMETHGRGGLNRVLLGSVADKVVRGATITVLVQRP
jgi:nucleotide-binding universal stress UspA family protein